MEIFFGLWFFLSPLAAVPAIWIVAKLMDKKVVKMMGAKSKFPLFHFSEELPNNNPNATHLITFNVFSAGDIKKSWKREFLIQRSKIKIQRSLLINLAIGFGYILFPFAILTLIPALGKGLPAGMGKSIGVPIGSLFILYHIFSYQSFVNEINLGKEVEAHSRNLFLRVLMKIIRFLGGIYGTIFRFIFGLLKLVPPNITTVFFPIMLFVMIVLLVVDLSLNNWGLRAGLVMALALHIFLKVKEFNWVKSSTNYKLLILRVFNVQSSTDFVFKNIWNYWRHIGSYFTIVDKSLLVLQNRKVWRSFIPITLLGFIINTTIIGVLTVFDLSPNDGANKDFVSIGIIIFTVISVSVYLIYGFKKISKSFIHSQTDLDQRLLQIEKSPISIFSTFKECPVRCYDNTWAFVVSEFVQLADVILMDLRGYSEARKGCQQEVILLLNHVPVSKVVFLLGKADLPQVKNLIEETCQNINQSSPNYNNENIQINIFSIENSEKKYESLNSEAIVTALINTIPINENDKKNK